jgi:uncharacterized iron-regulated protein
MAAVEKRGIDKSTGLRHTRPAAWKEALMARFVIGLLIAGALAPGALAADDYTVQGPGGQPATLGAIAQAITAADVVYLGEEHDDAVGHRLEAELLRLAAENAGKRPVALALEMFEQDVQPVVDEYMAELIREKDFEADSRPWPNYKAAYEPLVAYAKGHNLAVIAANAPKRYVNRVSRLGPGSLEAVSEPARRWLAPLPLPSASAAYAAKFSQQMGEMGQHAGPGLLAAQVLRDATMAWAIGRYLAAHPGALVVSVNGKFHSEGGLGIPEQLNCYRTGVRQLVVTMVKAPGPDEPAPQGDFVIRTRPKGP